MNLTDETKKELMELCKLYGLKCLMPYSDKQGKKMILTIKKEYDGQPK